MPVRGLGGGHRQEWFRPGERHLGAEKLDGDGRAGNLEVDAEIRPRHERDSVDEQPVDDGVEVVEVEAEVVVLRPGTHGQTVGGIVNTVRGRAWRTVSPLGTAPVGWTVGRVGSPPRKRHGDDPTGGGGALP